ncbi:Histidine kinase-, DNA gyrase B-, and HSP90-like ATPase [Mucilaginibacter mallensis]|uniref:histidine kinase n=1 Tax=Mucilaginibacter mallensis TaxID=652787 RepID=A0A1H1XD20_MUCMA|nr:ATP-binding protein [Mucilaginibacter mallensis]SDT06509.1 Histidine kinase-, DNA gyrase B-, and HSP90-like ATPase [Mucilaginibacter mallensis]
MSLFENHLFDNDTPDLANIINSVNVGIWEFDVNNKEVKWSAGLFNILGYKPGEIESSYLNFIDNLIYYQDRASFLATINNRTPQSSEITYIRILTKNGYEWFQSTVQRHARSKITGTLINVNQFKFSELQLETNNTFIAETNKLLKVGSWEFNTLERVLFFNNEALEILELHHRPATVDELIAYFEPEHVKILAAAMEDCIRIGRPYDLDLKLKTGRGKIIWTKMKAVAKIDNYGKCLAVKGVIQDIDVTKHSENKLKSTLHLTNQKNERLQNFAYITSHNLRSYASNLKLMLNLYEESKSYAEQQTILSHIRTISASLNATIEHLNEIVKIDLVINEEKILIEFELLFKNILNALQSNIQAANAIIEYDFSECPGVYYLPAYLESIFHNLLTNALKYRSPSRQAVVKCKSIRENEHVYLIFEDNGMGIDMKKNGNKIFGMYQTFHANADAQGIGLYITRNQIEALGGSINVDSALNIGTKFTIKLS